MSDQFSLFGPPLGDGAPSGVKPAPAPARGARAPVGHSLFFAVQPSAEDAARIAALAAATGRRLEIGGKPLEPGRLHVSLYAVGAYVDVFPSALVERLLQASAGVEAPAFEVVFDQLATFGGEALALSSGDAQGVAALHAFRRDLGCALADAGESISDRKMTPHMTVAYRGRPLARTPVEPIRWTAGEFVLIDSHVGASLHQVLGRWSLTR